MHPTNEQSRSSNLEPRHLGRLRSDLLNPKLEAKNQLFCD